MIDVDAMTRTLDELGMKVSTIGTGQAYVDDRIYFTSPDPEISAAAVQRIQGTLIRLATQGLGRRSSSAPSKARCRAILRKTWGPGRLPGQPRLSRRLCVSNIM